jgi:putative DNA primase/helicase
LREELPGILLWALDGLESLATYGRFTEPSSSRRLVQEMRENASPVMTFVRERCNRGPKCRVKIDDIWSAWLRWCEENGQKPGNKQALGSGLRAVEPRLDEERPQAGKGKKRHRYYTYVELKPEYAYD